MDKKGEAPAPAPFERLCAEVLKAIGKTLGQMNLYSANHPAVKAILAETAAMLGQILSQAGGGLAYSLDNEKVIANGKIIGLLRDIPTTIPTTFNRFKLSSIAFTEGVTVEELTALCQLAALRPDAAKGVDPVQFLKERGVSRIQVNEARYAKVDGAEEKGPSGPSGLAGAPLQTGGAAVAELAQRISSMPLEESLDTLVKSAVPDPGDQILIRETVMRRIRDDIQKEVVKATTELRQQKTAAENVSTRTQAVIGNVSGGVVVVDDQGKVLMMNPEAEELFGTKIAQAAGKPLTQNVKEEHMLALSAEIPVPKDRPIGDKVEVIGTDDARRTLRASTVVVQDETGKPVGMVAALSDKAKHREMEKMEREFVAHVTHELRAPLTSIRAALEILDGMFSGRLQNEEKRMMDNALRNTDRLEELIKGILDFSKIESGQMTVYPKAADPAKVAQEAVEGMQPWAMRKGVALTVVAEPELPVVHVDIPRTVQVIVNLISNAIKFTPKTGSIKVHVGRGSGDKSKFVVFCVADTGPGIPKAEQDRIFEKFIQIASGEQHVGGTGLGLAIAKALIHLQKGQMWLESAPGAGSKFYFTLPIFTAPSETGGKPKPEAKKPWWKRLFGG